MKQGDIEKRIEVLADNFAEILLLFLTNQPEDNYKKKEMINK
ncbi:MAG: hypothetical protein PHN69_06830 [Candidatus Pacebacteria bacterium]|nr:hypothetical protein [Candidatus Paceibacterota bacterium]